MNLEQPKAKQIFLAAAEITSADERRAYVEAQCGGDSALRHEVDQLLAHHLGADREFLQSPPLEPPILLTPSGTMIGRYKVLEPIGEGGYGAVFLAEQTSPVHRKVALKIIKAGMDTRQVIARFEAERQALALMDHPNIAKVFDAGTTDTGRPYFVMELVEGVPITKYCDEHRFRPRERLELFIQVCFAVQHAHQKGIIHRDLKPSNVLIALYDGKPVPKVIDFGIAKATGQQLTDRTMFTGLGDVIGTPQYMSPEQAELNQPDIDTRSDIYSLGVLLYELLTGTTPIEHKRVRGAALLEVLRVIREEEPPRASTRLSTAEGLPGIAAQRGLEPKKLCGLVHGELDWIVMKALEKERNHRYETANGFARDIERYLNDEPVVACPPSAAYRFRKFARRHRGGLLVASGAVATLVLLVIGLAVSNRIIAAERNQKSKALAEKEEALRLAQAESDRAEYNFRRASITIGDTVTKAALGVGEWSSLPLPLRKRFAEEAAKFYESLVQQETSDPNLRYETAVGYRAMGTLQTSFGETPKAEQLTRRSVEILDRLAIEHPAVAKYRHQLAYSSLSLGRLLHRTKQVDDAKSSFERSVKLYESLLKEEPTSRNYRNEIITCYRALSAFDAETGNIKRGEEVILRAMAILEQPTPQDLDDPGYAENLAQVQFSLAQLRARQGQVGAAKVAFRAAAKRYEEAFSKRQNAAILYHWASCYEELMKLPNNNATLAAAEGEETYRQFLEVQSRIPADLKAHPDLRNRAGHVNRVWSMTLRIAGRLAEAEAPLRQAIAIFDGLTHEKTDEATNWHYLADTHTRLGGLMNARGRRQEAEQAFRRAIELHEQRVARFPTWVHNEHERAAAYFELAQLLIKTGRMQEALPVATRSVEIDTPKHGQPAKLKAQIQLGDLLREAQEFDQALAKYSEVIAANPNLVGAWSGRGACYLAKGELAKAAEDFTEAIKLKPEEGWRWHQRARVHAQMRRPNEALADLRQAIAKGFKDAERMKSDGMLEPLRTNDDFKRLLTELEEEDHGKLSR